ncbi:MAG: histidine triad (HIT) protein [Treponema sp. GWB1_62_6]|nr:MAG: histidine triad (HIT) protein [Treponema sp. GWB1_62_6]OHE69217.1 MAG: histidine triad (HIT) protein [Treponema sp. GWC1_61_84]HCM26158.1 histidine triad (HIT) protein [Treponema sp.]
MDYFFNFEKLVYLRGAKPAGCILCCVRDGDPAVVDLTVHAEKGFRICLNLYPYNPGHLLVFPERHIVDLRECRGEERQALDSVIDRALDVLDEEFHPEGYNIGCNMGLVAGASINHLHWHIIPRYPREIGVAELLAGKRVLVENPLETRERLSAAFSRSAGIS